MATNAPSPPTCGLVQIVLRQKAAVQCARFTSPWRGEVDRASARSGGGGSLAAGSVFAASSLFATPRRKRPESPATRGAVRTTGTEFAVLLSPPPDRLRRAKTDDLPPPGGGK